MQVIVPPTPKVPLTSVSSRFHFSHLPG